MRVSFHLPRPSARGSLMRSGRRLFPILEFRCLSAPDSRPATDASFMCGAQGLRLVPCRVPRIAGERESAARMAFRDEIYKAKRKHIYIIMLV